MKNNFGLVARQGLLGAIVGLAGGLLLGIIIVCILRLATEVIGDRFDKDMVTLSLLLAMGFGSIIGGVFGAATGLRK